MLTLTMYGLRLWLLHVRTFDPDEFEHLHAAWLFSTGQLPYRDFFEHHTPALYFLLRPLFALFRVETSFEEALAAMRFARQLMWVLTGVILLSTFRLGCRWRQWRLGLLGTVFLGNTIMFLDKTLETRPDVPAVACWMMCLVAVTAAVQAADSAAWRTRGSFIAGGLLVGLAIVTTQKMLFVLPGLALALLWYLLDGRSHGTFQTRLGNIVCHGAGLAVPMALTLAYFASRHGLREFVEFNLLLKLGWQSRVSPWLYTKALALQNPVIMGLGIIGLARTAWGMFHQAAFRRGDFILVLNTLGLMAGLFVIPVPQRQYYLMFLPLLALFAARALLDAIYVALSRRDVLRKYLAGIVALATLVLGSMVGLSVATISHKADFGARVAVALFVFSVALIPIACRRTGLALIILIFGLSLSPLVQMRRDFFRRNHTQLAAIRYVLENTSPQDTVMDGWEGVGVFRPHAWFHWMVHGEILALLSERQKRQLLEDLRAAVIAPRLVNLDHSLKQLSPEITAFLMENYAAVGVGRLRVRKEAPGDAPRPSPPQPLTSGVICSG